MGIAMNQMRVARNQWGQRITAPGCDDAPVVDVGFGEPKLCTLIVPYYNNPVTLIERVRAYACLSEETRAMFRLIVVDDGSPLSAFDAIKGCGVEHPEGFSLYRIKDDIRFNWLAARNIGAHEAEDNSWLILTDMDHFLSRPALDACIFGKHDPSIVYRFTRRDRESTGIEIHPHPNSWMMTRELYWEIGGYDERLSGLYGTDGSFRRRVAAAAPIAILDRPLIRREFEKDSSTIDYKRKQPQDRSVHKIVAELENSPPKVLSFAYERVL